MRKSNYGFKREFNVETIKERVQRAFFVYADEGKGEGINNNPDDTKPEGDTNKQDSSINYEDLISKARKEEKEKLYPKISNLEKEKEELVKKSNESIIKIAELQSKLEEAEVKKNSDLDKTSKQVEDEKEEIANLKKALEDKELELKEIVETTEDVQTVEERVRKEVESEYEVKLYREQKLREVSESGKGLIPELVTGTTKEDIDNSLSASQERFNEIVKQTMSGVKVPPANTSVSKLNTKDYNLEDLAQLDPRSEEYRELRAKLGLK